MRAMEDSGVEWIGEIPTTWEVKPIGYGFAEIKNKNANNKLLSPLQFKYGTIVSKAKIWTGDEAEDTYSTYNVVSENTIMINGLNLEFDFITQRVAIVTHKGIITSAYLAIQPNNEIHPSYAMYLLKAYDALKVFHSLGRGLRKTLAFSELKKQPFLFPALGEQEYIVTFLDVKCAQIDAIIEKQQQVIEKLKEYKQSVITEAVTKGLDPTVPMKDSGVEWIGMMPEKWERVRIKTYAKLKTGTTPPTTNQEFFDGDYNWFTPSDFSDTLILDSSSRKVNYMAIELGIIPEFDAGSVLLVAIGATLGKVGYINEKCSSNQQITAITPAQKIIGKYLAYYLRAMMNVIRDYALYTTLPIINNQTLGTFWYALPSGHEQALIIERLDAICESIENGIDKKLTIIERLTNYKKSLIYEAVTGKMEV